MPEPSTEKLLKIIKDKRLTYYYPAYLHYDMRDPLHNGIVCDGCGKSDSYGPIFGFNGTRAMQYMGDDSSYVGRDCCLGCLVKLLDQHPEFVPNFSEAPMRKQKAMNIDIPPFMHIINYGHPQLIEEAVVVPCLRCQQSCQRVLFKSEQGTLCLSCAHTLGSTLKSIMI
jgi:hypothetical protein